MWSLVTLENSTTAARSAQQTESYVSRLKVSFAILPCVWNMVEMDRGDDENFD